MIGVADPGGVGAEEDGSGGDLIAGNRHCHRQVMPLEPPRPGLVARRIAEYRDPVIPAVPTLPPPFTPVKHLLQGDDPHRLRVGVLAQRGGQQAMSSLAAGPVHVRDAGAGAGQRAVFQPPPRIVVGERPGQEVMQPVVD